MSGANGVGIVVNGQAISAEAINIESAQHQEPGGDPRVAQHRAAVALTVRELLRQRAEHLGMDAPADDEERLEQTIEALLEEEVPVPEADEETCRRWYEQNLHAFRTPDLAEVRHILIAAPPEVLAEREAARETAEGLIAELQRNRAQGSDTFAELARQHSRCPSASDGGHLGAVSRGETVPEFEDAVLRLPVGLAEAPVKTRYGFHVVEVLQRVSGEQLPYDQVRERIASYLHESSRRRALSQYLKMLAGEADLRGIDLEQADSPLLQ